MFDYIRVAAFATLAAGAAGATAHISPDRPSVQPAIMTTVAPPEGEALPLEEPKVPAPEVDTAPPRADSLAALVRREAANEADNDEQHCLAVATYFESKGEPLAGQLAVARVILNRTESGRFARTVCGVVKQPGQFSFVRGGALPSRPRAAAQWRTAVAIARIAQQDMWTAPAANALFFHAKRVSPGWGGKTRIAAVGNHVFYR